MRKVPASASYLIIGDGRVARHFGHYLSLLNIPYYQWHRRLTISLEDVLDSAASVPVLLLINDEAIEPFILKHCQLLKKQCIHFSGSLVSDLAVGAHPLMTFGPELYTLGVYKKIPWVLERAGPCFSTLFPLLPNPSWAIERQQKSYYHALCVMANNFTTLLWQKLFNEMEQHFQIPNIALHPLLQCTLKNITKDPHSALTGPLARREKETIKRHLLALEHDTFKDIYQAFVASYECKKK